MGTLIPLDWSGGDGEPEPVETERAALIRLMELTLERISREQHRLGRQRSALEAVLRRMRTGEDQGLVRARLNAICPEFGGEA